MTIVFSRSILGLAALVLPSLFAASVAHAGPQCTTQPRSAWQNAEKFQAELKSQGYQITKFKITSGQCYEIYGRDKAGKNVEIYFDPVSGQIVKQESR